jgi:hypothetical protein
MHGEPPAPHAHRHRGWQLFRGGQPPISQPVEVTLPLPARLESALRRRPLSHHRIEINLRDVNQLFNSMDPSPFHEKDLDHDAEEFIVSWVQEYHRHDPVTLVIHLQQLPVAHDARQLVEKAIHNYFAYRARLNRLEFNRLMKQGRMSLGIGAVFLAACLTVGNLLSVHTGGNALMLLLRETLMIAGTVAMWRPMEIYLYEWWPLRRRGQIFEKMSRMKVEVIKPDGPEPQPSR